MSALGTATFFALDAQGVASVAGHNINWQWFALGGFLIFVFLVAWVWVDNESHIRDLKNIQPELELGEPEEHPNESLDRVSIWGDGPVSTASWQIALYRVPVYNKRGSSLGVSVKLMRIAPDPKANLPKASMPIILRETGDNPGDHISYKRSFPMGRDDTTRVDVIAIDKNPPHHCFIYSIASPDAAQEMELDGNYTFTLKAIAERSSALTDYKVDIDANHGKIVMVRKSRDSNKTGYQPE